MWHEARRSERKVHDLMDAARKRAQRRAVFLAKRRGDPQQSLMVVGSRCRTYRDDGIYQATQDQQGLIPWNGKQDILIDRFDGRALLDFIRDSSSRNPRVQSKTEEEEELEEFVNFERYRDLIKHRRRGCRYFLIFIPYLFFSMFFKPLFLYILLLMTTQYMPRNVHCFWELMIFTHFPVTVYELVLLLTVVDEEGLQHAKLEIEAKITAPFVPDRSLPAQPPAPKGSYSQVGFSYDGDGKEEAHFLDSDDDSNDEEDEDDDYNSDDSNDVVMENIAKDFGVKRYGWLVYMDKKAKEEAKRQKEVVKGDPAIKKLSRKERRKVSQIEREREREASRITGTRVLRHDPYRESRRSPTYEAYSRSRRSRSRSRSYSPSYSRRYDRGHSESSHRSKPRAPKIEYITEFGGSADVNDQKLDGFGLGLSPPPSPPSQVDVNRPSTGRILEALHTDPASAVSLDQEKNSKVTKPAVSTSSGLAKLSKPTASIGCSKPQQGEKKETPQERLKRIMSKQLNKQIKKDTAAEIAKKREQERQRQEKLAEMSRASRYRSRSRSRSHSRSPPRRRRSRSKSRSRSPPPRRHYSRSRSPRVRSRSRY